jgi:hypothetical protein
VCDGCGQIAGVEPVLQKAAATPDGQVVATAGVVGDGQLAILPAAWILEYDRDACGIRDPGTRAFVLETIRWLLGLFRGASPAPLDQQ